MAFIGEDAEPLYRVMQSRQNYNIVSRFSRAMGEQPNIDLNSRSKRLYGKVDVNYNPLMLLPDQSPTEFLNSEVTGLGFVVDACNAFIDEYNAKMQENPEQIIPSLGMLKVGKQLIDYETIAEQRRKVIASYIASYYLNLYGKNIATFEDFLEKFMRWAQESAAEDPITNSGLIMSHSVPHSITGLVVEFGNYNENDDDLRSSIVMHENFPIYSNMAAQYGFYITRNSPWRLVANVESSIMQGYIANYIIEPYTDVTDFFEDFYIKAYLLDFRDFRSFVLATYNTFVHFNPIKKINKICDDGTLKVLNQYRFKTSMEELDEKYSPVWWLSKLYDFRCFEVNMPAKTEAQKNLIYEKIETAFNTAGTNSALEFINERIKENY